MSITDRLKRISFVNHLIIGAVIRIALIVYGKWQDRVSEVKYTDVDYRVITDAARHVLNHGSPYQRHTYRYTPLLAWLAIPNCLVHDAVAKVFFSIFDLLVGVLIQRILCDEFWETFRHNAAAIQQRVAINRTAAASPPPFDLRLPDLYRRKATMASLVWLYNPLPMVIATRGNGDSITCFLVLASMYILLRPSQSNWQFFFAGILHGLSIHFRLYPIVFSLSYYIYAAQCGGGEPRSWWRQMLLPNGQQKSLVFGTCIILMALTLAFCDMYGDDFIQESYLYHLQRKDTRHNFSLYFYLQYLSSSSGGGGGGSGGANSKIVASVLEKCLITGPQLVILLAITLTFSHSRKVLPMSIFLQSFTMVTFNSVITSQYFVWYLAILPLCLKNWSRITQRAAVAYAALWLLAQGAWLLAAYMLEFRGWNTFNTIWLSGCLFFGVNIFIMQRLIVAFNVVADLTDKRIN